MSFHRPSILNGKNHDAIRIYHSCGTEFTRTHVEHGEYFRVGFRAFRFKFVASDATTPLFPSGFSSINPPPCACLQVLYCSQPLIFVSHGKQEKKEEAVVGMGMVRKSGHPAYEC